MNRGIIIVGMTLSCIVMLFGFAQSLITLIQLVDMLSLLYSVPAAVVGTVLTLWFGHEFVLTFNGSGA